MIDRCRNPLNLLCLLCYVFPLAAKIAIKSVLAKFKCVNFRFPWHARMILQGMDGGCSLKGDLGDDCWLLALGNLILVNLLCVAFRLFFQLHGWPFSH